MKKRILGLFSAVAIALGAVAADCEIDITVVAPDQGAQIPAGVATKLKGKLTHLLAQTGLASSAVDGKFFLTGRFDHGYFEKIGTTEALVTTLTLYIGDADDQKIYATTAIELKGVGRSEEQAYTKAMNGINKNNSQIKEFITQGRQKIIDYFNSNYQSYLAKARNAMTARNYDEALYYSTQIPECCVGFKEASALTQKIYGDQVNYIGANMLAEAKAAFAADPTAAGAAKAFSYLTQIDPNSTSYAAGQALADQMQKTVKQQWEFENIQKYKDELAMKKQQMANEAAAEQARIKAAKAIGVAWAKAQQKTVVVRSNYYHWW